MSETLKPTILSALKAMYENIPKWYYTRELARLAKIGRTTVSREFNKLAKKGIVAQKQEAQGKFYRLNLLNPQTRKLCELFASEKREKLYDKNRRVAYVLEDLAKYAFESLPDIQSIVLFGSVARGQITGGSDIDLLVLVPNQTQDELGKTMKAVEEMIAAVSGVHPVKLAPVVMTMKDFEQSLKDGKRFALDVLRDGIVVFGEERYHLLLSKVLV